MSREINIYTIESTGLPSGTKLIDPEGNEVKRIRGIQWEIEAGGIGVLTLRINAGLRGTIGGEVRMEGTVNDDPIQLFKRLIREGVVRVYLAAKNPAINQSTDAYTLHYSGQYARFTLVDGQFPAIHGHGACVSAPELPLVEYAAIPVAMRHALAGWILTAYKQRNVNE